MSEKRIAVFGAVNLFGTEEKIVGNSLNMQNI